MKMPVRAPAVEHRGLQRQAIHVLRNRRGWRAFARHDVGDRAAIFSNRGGGAADWLTPWFIILLFQQAQAGQGETALIRTACGKTCPRLTDLNKAALAKQERSNP